MSKILSLRWVYEKDAKLGEECSNTEQVGYAIIECLMNTLDKEKVCAKAARDIYIEKKYL